ncbi:hydroxysqualene dehydroxylase HpnE [Thiobacter aerophilum]|uniref:Hydroxysqualene dehydroxylase HpnE n=1 Tax=Thiobacter aerophilum TaxID=3121275 RepID=A0ABV0EBG7_9BURK
MTADAQPHAVAVIGAGWAGLAAAVKLAAHGMPVTVFESAPHAGGRARSVWRHKLELDNGQHVMLGAYRETQALLDLVNPGWRAQVVRLPLRLLMKPGFSLKAPRLPAPWHLAAALITARGLAWADRLAALRFFTTLSRQSFRLERDRPVIELLRQHRQTRALCAYLWHPLCFAALNTPPAVASAQVFANVLRETFAHRRADSDLLLPRVCLSHLFPKPAAAFLRRHGGALACRQKVTRLKPMAAGWQVMTANGAAVFRHVICALPPVAAARLLETLPGLEETAARLGRLEYEPIYTLYLRYREQVRLDAPMVGLLHGPGQWVFDRGQLTGPANLLAVVISAHGPHETLDHTHLGQAVTRQLCDELGICAPPQDVWVIAEKRATFACTPNLLRPEARTPLAGLFLAGDWVGTGRREADYPATIEGAVRSGVQCARHILESP